MTDKKEIDLQIHCLVDDEITRSDRAEVMAHLEHDDELRTYACALSHQKELVRLAYADVQEPNRQPIRRHPVLAIAASLALAVVGAFSYLTLTDQQNNGVANNDQNRVVLLDADGSGQQLADPARDETRIVFQLTNPDMAKAAEVLDEVESVLNFYAHADKPLRVELVAHGEGMSVLRSRLTDHANRIADLDHRFDNLTFVACQNTIERISNEQGFGVDVLPQVVIIQSGVNHVAKRQGEGWAYIHL